MKMAKYRIVKKKHNVNTYMVQQRGFAFFWYNLYGYIIDCSLEECEQYIQMCMEREKIKKDNPRDIVVKTY
jgi:hypothetical protein